ncbi:MAG: hypothetical protein ACJ76F_13180 [Bacteroidia bacterium]
MKNRILLLSLLLTCAFSLCSLAATDRGSSAKQITFKTKYRLVVSFISIGAGIDNESYDKITSYIKSHPKKPAFEEVQKGREGERTIYMKLNELSADERKTFIDDINKMIVKKELVKTQEDVKIKKIRAKF